MDDRKPVPHLAQEVFGKIFGDRGYISSQLFQELFQRGTQLVTKLRKGMKNKLMSLKDKTLLKRRGLIESVNNKLKSSCQIEHHRHRSWWNFLVNLFGGLVAYCIDPNKPKMRFENEELVMLENLAAT